MGGEVKIFDPAGLPLADSEPETHPKVQDLRKLNLVSRVQAAVYAAGCGLG